MVRALLAGTKTQTRRLVKPQPNEDGLSRPLGAPYWHDTSAREYRCPYGKAGDRLWVRENGWERPERTPRMLREGADTWAPYYFDAEGVTEADAADFRRRGFKRRPSIHMPRWASRLLLEVVSVRVERLQDISEADCIAEGTRGGHGAIPGYHYNATPQEHYWWLWEHLNGRGSWNANPWLWVVEFKRVTP